MAEIRPLRGLRYNATAGPLSSLVAPPYDVLSPSERDGYAVRSPYNVVHLTLPEQKDDDRSKFVRYARSAALLTQFRREEVLIPEPTPALYRYTQSFGMSNQATFSRTSIIALLKLEPFDKGVVLPHEQTFPKHKEDRLRILEATRAHLETIFGLFEDGDGSIMEALLAAAAGTAVECRSDEGVHHRLEPITDDAAIAGLQAQMADKKIWIADGHHRYETALAFREALGERDTPVAEDFIPMAMSSLSDPNLVLLPTHRIVSRIGELKRPDILRRLSEAFSIQETHSSRLMDMIERSEQSGIRAIGMAMEGGLGYVLTPHDDAALVAGVSDEGSEALRSLDVSILHSVILDRLLGIKSGDGISYTRDQLEAIRAADQGAAASFLMVPPSVRDMQQIALGGERMPQKSTYYFPKILSGLVLWSLNDFAST